MAFDWKTDAQGKKYRVAARQRGYFHVYQNGAVKKLGGPRPTGFNQFNEKNRSYYKNVDDGITSQHVYQNGRKVNMGAGSIFQADPGLLPFYKQGMAASDLKYGIPQRTLQTQMGRERGAQGQAYGQIANYYAGMAGNAKSLMDQAGQVGQQTDASLKSIGADRNSQIQSATPQYSGPLGAIAQNMANSEQQAALNRGAAVDQSNRAMNTMTSGNRQAYLGEVGAGQQIAGQERLSTLKGQGQQALNVYADKIAELERQKALGAVDSANQLRTAQQTYGLNTAKADLNAAKADQTASYQDAMLGIAQQNADANTTRANKPPVSKPKGNSNLSNGITPASNNSFWGKAQTGASILANSKRAKTRENADLMYNYLIDKKHFTALEANVARAMWMYGGKLSPYAASSAKQAGYDITPYGIQGR
jgi:hypothetical protein